MPAAATGTDKTGEGIVPGAVVGVGYALMMTLIVADCEQKPRPGPYVLINGIYNVLGLVSVAAILSVWR